MESNKKQLNQIVNDLRWSIGVHFGLDYEVTMTPCSINMIPNFNMPNNITTIPHPPSIFFHFKYDFYHVEFDKILKYCLKDFANLYINHGWDPYDYKGYMITLHTDNINVSYCKEHKSLSVDEYENFCNIWFIDFLQHIHKKIPEYYDQINNTSTSEEEE